MPERIQISVFWKLYLSSLPIWSSKGAETGRSRPILLGFVLSLIHA
jgi:hypothetical protein